MFGFEIFQPRVSVQEVARQRCSHGNGPDFLVAWNEVPGRPCGPDFYDDDGNLHSGWGSVFVTSMWNLWEWFGSPPWNADEE